MKNMKWVFLLVGFVLCFLGLEIYHNTEVMDRGYLLQQLRGKKENLEDKNGFLKQQISSSFSLSELENYARDKLGLINPRKVRFLEKKISPPDKSSSPSPDDVLTDEKKK